MKTRHWIIGIIAVILLSALVRQHPERNESSVPSQNAATTPKATIAASPSPSSNPPSAPPMLPISYGSATSPEVALSPSPPFSLSTIPAFSGKPYTESNGNRPYFTESEITDTSFERYSEFDDLGRCGTAVACVGRDIMPTEPRGGIGMIKPSGWHTVRYDDLIEGRYLYNRCHLLGYQLTGENANVKNLITGTRYMNIEGMLPFENQVASYVEHTGNHVMYRTTPVFEGSNLLASGVLIEALSVEDGGSGVCFCVFVYNVQPGIDIDYATGDSARAVAAPDIAEDNNTPSTAIHNHPSDNVPATANYVGNKNTKKFHYPSCSSVKDMKEKNKLYYSGNREGLIGQGYQPCKRCNP